MAQDISAKAWGGVFTGQTASVMERFSESISFDKRLYKQDIAGSIAHAHMLSDVGILTETEFQSIESGLKEIEAQLDAGTFPFSIDKEDIHMHIEQALTDKLGDTGRKLHTGRSRNDQVSTDFRLWVRDAIDQIDARLEAVQSAFVGRCKADRDIILPGYTHTQRAQPVLAPHYWLCYTEKFQRDRERLADCRKRVNTLSLGAAALAGTSIPIDRFKVAQYLGFQSVAANSLDVSSDRDFAIEFVFCLTLIAEHLSTLAEEWIWWFSSEFQFIKLPQAFCTGSSIMPQKINPDAMELIRGKTGRTVGDLQTLLVLVKGLTLAYNRDLQEDKPAVFDAFDSVDACLELVAPIIQNAELNRKRIEEKLDRGYLDATTFMEYLIGKGVPQRTAHHIVGNLVKICMNQDCRLADLPLSEFQKQEPSLTDDLYNILGVKNAIQAFRSYGSTAPEEVNKQIDAWEKRLK